MHVPRCLLSVVEQAVERGVSVTSADGEKFVPAETQRKDPMLGDLVFIDRANQVGCVIWVSERLHRVRVLCRDRCLDNPNSSYRHHNVVECYFTEILSLQQAIDY